MLGNSNEDGLMVGGGIDRSETVGTSGQTTCDISRQDTTLSFVVQTLEEGELSRVRRLSRGDGLNLLDDDVRVTLDITLSVDLLRSGEVVLVGVDEVTGLEVLDGHRNRESGVGLDSLTVNRECELG